MSAQDQRLTDTACPDCGNVPGGDGCGYSSTCACPTCGTAAYCDGAC